MSLNEFFTSAILYLAFLFVILVILKDFKMLWKEIKRVSYIDQQNSQLVKAGKDRKNMKIKELNLQKSAHFRGRFSYDKEIRKSSLLKYNELTEEIEKVKVNPPTKSTLKYW